jgi:membrane-associated protease RseP (regulator of RpoE activity)
MFSLREEYAFIIFLIIFWLVIYLLGKIVNVKKHGLIISPFFIRYNSEEFKRILYKYSSKWKTFWKIFSYISVILGFSFMIFALVFLSGNLVNLSFSREESVPVSIVVPGLTLSIYWLPYFLISVILVVFIHEAAHGIIALTEGISIKSAGMLLLAVFPGGFVEIEDEKINGLKTDSKLKIFSAGASANVLFGLLIFLTLFTLFIQTPSGIVVMDVVEGGPLDLAGIKRWDVICALNGTPIHDYRDLADFMSGVKPGEKVLVATSRGNFTILTVLSPEDGGKAIIGIMLPSLLYYPSRLGLGFFWDIQIYLILNWLFLISINVAIFNMLPIPALDGDKFLQCLLQGFSERSMLIKKFFNIFSIFLIAVNMALSL